jgi:hypothetical protein
VRAVCDFRAAIAELIIDATQRAGDSVTFTGPSICAVLLAWLPVHQTPPQRAEQAQSSIDLMKQSIPASLSGSLLYCVDPLQPSTPSSSLFPAQS